MRKATITVKTKKKFRVTTDSKHTYPAVDNLIIEDLLTSVILMNGLLADAQLPV
jgi:hypothetical protein